LVIRLGSLRRCQAAYLDVFAEVYRAIGRAAR
jgi:hypothetical protein